MPKLSVTSRTCDKQAQSTWVDSYDTWNFPANQSISIQTWNILCWRWTWALSVLFHFQGAINPEPTLQKAYMHIILFTCIMASMHLL
jgi:hypothetical protein